jgi:MSHA pilin protein MshC
MVNKRQTSCIRHVQHVLPEFRSLAIMRGQRGFTMVELVTVMVIAGVLAAMLAPRFFGRSVFESRGFYDQVVSTLRYAQKAAIAQRRFVCVSFPDNSSITLKYGTDNTCAGGTLASPSETPYPLTNSNASFTVTPVEFNFDGLGRPYNKADTPPISTFVKQSITVSGYATLITVEAETGYVH